MADTRVFPWAREYDDARRAAFIGDVWVATGNGDDLATLDAMEDAVARHAPEPEPEDAGRPACPLTTRETEFLTALANGLTYDQVAATFHVGRHTVQSICQAAYTKVGARSAARATAIAAHHGWLPDLRIPPRRPLPAARGPQAWQEIYRQAVAQMRETPGEDIEIGPYQSLKSARNTIWRINSGLWQVFQPAGTFRATTARTEYGDCVVRARYLGEPTPTDTTAPGGGAR